MNVNYFIYIRITLAYISIEWIDIKSPDSVRFDEIRLNFSDIRLWRTCINSHPEDHHDRWIFEIRNTHTHIKCLSCLKNLKFAHKCWQIHSFLLFTLLILSWKAMPTFQLVRQQRILVFICILIIFSTLERRMGISLAKS